MRALIVLAAALLASLAASAQTCPTNEGDALQPSALHGKLLLHDELREWLGIKLDRPACGEDEVQLIFPKNEDWRKAETLRGCGVTAIGNLYESPTGYYSANTAISNATLNPDSSCHPFPVRPDSSAVPIPPTVRAYRSSITVDYRGKGHVGVKVWQGHHRRVLLKPWQAYVNYSLTGGQDVIWFDCQKDFRIGNITQVPASPDGLLQDVPRQSGAALQDMEGANVIEFTCRKKP